VDEQRLALSNQFFAKTAANVRANRAASLLVVCPRTGDQYLLDLAWEGVADRGPVFDRIDRALKAAIAQTGMANIMRLKAIDIFVVTDVHHVPGAAGQGDAVGYTPQPEVRDVLAMLGALAEQSEVEGVLETLIQSACRLTECDNALVFLHEAERSTLTAVASRGYAVSGIGAEVPVGDLLIGQAAATGATLKISDLSRVERLGRAAGAMEADDTKAIALPRLQGALSQIAVPLKVQGEVHGVLFVEAARRLAFDETMAAGLEALARQAAASLQLAGQQADDDVAPAPSVSLPKQGGAAIRVRVHRFDDSVFIDDQYAIKGVAGRLLAWLVARALAEGRSTFSNREIRKDAALRLPEFKDNLETRLLLLSRRLDDRQFPIRLHRRDRGIMELELQGSAVLDYCD
jgi:adenylate cyclase